MSSSSLWDDAERLAPLGRYCDKGPFVFSLMPRCHELFGSVKYPFTPRFLREIGVSSAFPFLFVGHRQQFLMVDAIQHTVDPFKRGVSGPDLQFGENYDQRGSLDECSDRGGVPSYLYGVAFPLTWNYPFVSLRRTHVDGDHVGDLTAPIFAPRPGATETTRLVKQADNLEVHPSGWRRWPSRWSRG